MKLYRSTNTYSFDTYLIMNTKNDKTKRSKTSFEMSLVGSLKAGTDKTKKEIKWQKKRTSSSNGPRREDEGKVKSQRLETNK